MVISFLQFLANLILAGFLLRFAESKAPDTGWGRALAFIY